MAFNCKRKKIELQSFVHLNANNRSMQEDRYQQRGVSAGKEDVHKAIKNMSKGLYEYSFCKVLPDISGGDESYCNVMHADTAGTKTSLAYLYWRETGDLSVWKGVVQDALVMNLDDLAAVGAIQNIIISSTIGRNSKFIPGEVLSVVIQAAQEFIEQMDSLGIKLYHSGGETADVGDIVRTIDIGFTTFGRLKRSDLVINNIKDGDVIVGLSSSGKASYETSYNGGMGSNGLTSARHDVLTKEYASKYPESYENAIPDSVVYSGSKKLTDTINIDGDDIPVGKLLLSPTRTYMPVLKVILDQVKDKISGIIHCTGGAQTKVEKFIKNKHIIKDELMDIPPLFKLIKEESGTDYKEMYKVFNMGHRLEIYLPAQYAQAVIDISNSFNIDAKIIGRVEDSPENKISITTPSGIVTY